MDSSETNITNKKRGENPTLCDNTFVLIWLSSTAPPPQENPENQVSKRTAMLETSCYNQLDGAKLFPFIGLEIGLDFLGRNY